MDALPRVLVIDDDAMLARGMARMLSSFKVVIETDPYRAVERACANEPFDIIVCDLHMPGMSGAAVLTAIRAHFAGCSAPRFIMTSGSEEAHALGALADVVMIKPFRATALRHQISSLLAAGHP